MKEDQLGVAANFGTVWKNRGTQAAHGTRQRYKMGCKCTGCLLAEADYQTGRRQARSFRHDDAVDTLLEVLAG